jgi:hypothetical protein
MLAAGRRKNPQIYCPPLECAERDIGHLIKVKQQKKGYEN